MSDANESQDKTEDPSAQKLRKARKEGQVARSRELQSAVLVTLGGIVLLMVSNSFTSFANEMMHMQFELGMRDMHDPSEMVRHLSVVGWMTIKAFIPAFFLLWLLLALSGLIPGGLIFTGKGFAPQFNRLDPRSGFKRMCSAHSLVELAKAIVKVTMLLGVIGWVLWAHLDVLLQMNRSSLAKALSSGIRLLSFTFISLGMVLLVIAVVDVPFQRWSMLKKLRMSKQEVKDEQRNNEGNPEIKKRIRQLQIQISRQRIQRRVPEADVVITNPTHYAVALKYDPQMADAPYVIAKGSDHLALRIREVANEHDKIILELPELTRAIYFSTRIDQEVPAGLYNAVAQVLMYVMQLSAFQAGNARPPVPLPVFKIPDALKR